MRKVNLKTMYLCLIAIITVSFMNLPLVSALEKKDVQSPSLLINIPSRTLELYSGNTIIKEYPIAVGAPRTPSPVGKYTIFYKEVNPWWYPVPSKNSKEEPRKPVPSGPDNPLGYRWMEFLPTYGIHGTNAPWSIGSAVSNGCIRMNEADVEELFELVGIGTPVQISYERVKIQVEESGHVILKIYPDIYGQQRLDVPEIKQKLEQAGFSGILSDDKIQRLLNSSGEQKLAIVETARVAVNNQLLTESVLVIQKQVYIPVWQVARSLKADIKWDDKNNLVYTPYKAVPGSVKGSLLYITAENCKSLFGGEVFWSNETNRLEINVPQVYVNGKRFPVTIQKIDNILAIPAVPLASELGLKVTIDKKSGILTSGTNSIPISVIGGEAYLQLNKVNEIFQAFVYWDEAKFRIDITFPFQSDV